MTARRPVVLLVLAAVLAVLILQPAVLAGPVPGTEQEGGAVHVVKVDCLRVNGSVRVNIVLALPNPAYRIVESSWSLEKGILRVNVTVERTTTGPVIQVVVHRGFSIELDSMPTMIVVYVNGSEIYTTSCGAAASAAQQGGEGQNIGASNTTTTPSQPPSSNTGTSTESTTTGQTSSSHTQNAGGGVPAERDGARESASTGATLARGLGAALAALGVLLVAVALRR